MDDRPGEGSELPDPIGGAERDGGPPRAPGDPSHEGSGELAPGADAEPSATDGEPAGLTPEQRALAEEAAEIRRMVEEGAGSPEAIRALAARLREHRAREEELWRTAVKPTLVKEGKGRLRGHAKSAPAEPRPAPQAKASQSLWLGGALLGLVLVVIVAANTTVWLLVLPVLVLLGWAWHQGRDTTSGQ